MKLDRIFSDLRKAIERILQAFDHNITVQDNFGPSGVPEGQVIVSRGPTLVPEWTDIGLVVSDDDDSDNGSGDGFEGPQGPPGPPGPPGPAAGTEVLACIVTTDGDVVVDDGEVVWSCNA